MIAALFDWPTTWSGAFTAVAAMLLFGGPISYAIIRYFGGHRKEPEAETSEPTTHNRNPVPAIEVPPPPIQLTDSHSEAHAKDQKTIERLERDVARLTASNAAKDAEIARLKAQITEQHATKQRELTATEFFAVPITPPKKPETNGPFSGLLS